MAVQATSEPSGEFYDWSFKRYQQKMRRAIVLLVGLVVLSLVAVAALAFAITAEHEEIISSQAAEHTHETEEEILALRAQIQDMQTQNVNATEQLRNLVLCIDRKTGRLDAGVKRLLSSDISANRFINNFQLPRCS
jgi:cell division protein FtsI/penicillin-binding protein 2